MYTDNVCNIASPTTFLYNHYNFIARFIFYCGIPQERNVNTICLAHNCIISYLLYWEHAVAQLVEALHYKPGGRGFDFR